MSYLFLIFLSILSGVFYRLGGAGKNGSWLDIFKNTKTRDFGVPALIIWALWPANLWTLFFTFGAQFGILTMGYGGEGEPKEEQSFLYRIFGKYVFFAVGFIYSLGLFPYILYLDHWNGFLFRVISLTIIIPLIHKYRRNLFVWDASEVEEFLRGFVLILSLILI